MKGRGGATLLETMVGIFVFSLLSVVMFAALRLGTDTWRTVEARHDAQRNLRQVEEWLRRDLASADPAEMNTKNLGGGDGDALWFLSALDPAADPTTAEAFVRDTADGSPEWGFNVIYYLVRPTNHDQVAGQSCNTGANPTGDAICPHKFLIRKVVDVNPGAPDTLLSSAAVASYTTAPNGYDTTAFWSEAGVVQTGTRVLSDRVLWFEVIGFVPGDRVLTVELAAVRIQEAQKETGLGTIDMLTSRFTVTHELRLIPQNVTQE